MASLTALAALVDAPCPETLPAVRSFLARYRERLLTPVELPAIREAYELASRGEARELLKLDRRLEREFGGSAFAEASRRTGRAQLRRLRPLRDATLKRYLQSVENGEAQGWHVIVFGILLALFSMPLRQGLVHYATKTQHTLLDSAMSRFAASAAECASLRRECEDPVLPAVSRVLPPFRPEPSTVTG